MSDVDHQLEQAIRDLLAGRQGSICPSDAARAVGDADSWRDLMEAARAAAARLMVAGEVTVTQGSETVDPAAARGPIRIRRPR